MNKNKKCTIAQGIIWAGAMLASAVISTGSGAQNQFIIIPILACGAAVSIIIQANSGKEANRSDLGDPKSKNA